MSTGAGGSDAERFCGHPSEVGPVQLYSSLGLGDEMIMDIVQMKEAQAYATFFDSHNDCASQDIPIFYSISETIRHTEQALNEKILGSR